ncbi:acid phosphatase [Paenibacillus shenyangensis]|uniref:acid phosphatase n=1 Tax=Paenibacillus sp. A9 TaxID=1284352 RepID=UPI0003686132|nr:phosphatase PAP2 family protein [Paenibacillus sp. A9]
MKSQKNKIIGLSLSLSVLAGSLGGTYAQAADLPSNVTPPKPTWGYFVDNYKNNTSDNMSVTSNPAIGVLSEFNKMWKPGTTWDSGTKLNSELLDMNIQKVINTAKKRTAAQEEAAYLDDRRNQSYSVIEGLGALTDIYRKQAGATTTITEVQADATTKKYDDEGTNSGDPNSSLGSMVTLVNTLRGSYSSTNPAKGFYNYKRPFRWSPEATVLPTLVPAIKADPTTDGGYPSGHTNAAYLTAFAMAYAVPERYQELLTRASELGNNRAVSGMHSYFDVMGGRVMATALSASILNDPANKEIKQAAYEQAQSKLLTQTGTAKDRFNDYKTNKKEYTERLTYGFPQAYAKDKPVLVPKGAEVLLETRQPYLDAGQRRWVLATTGIPSGYPVLDDAEGWGRLNLFAAADGYGAFVNNVTVNMDAAKGGFNKEDTWRNDIAGKGGLTKKGTGTLNLDGKNTYTGKTRIVQGTLEGGSTTAFGRGDVSNEGGTLVENAIGKVKIGGDYKQSSKGTLTLTIGSKKDVLDIDGTAVYAGKLQLNFVDSYVPKNNSTIIVSDKSPKHGKFTSVQAAGLPAGYTVKAVYTNKSVKLQVKKK